MLQKKSEYCSSCEDCNARSPLFSLLTRDELKTVNEGRFEVSFNSGETIVKQGTSATHLLSLTSGMAKMFLEGIDKKNLILDIIMPLRLFGGPGIFTDMRYHYSVVALTDATACFISVDGVRSVLRSNPDFAEGMIRHCNRNSSTNFDRLISLTQKQMPGRLADALLYLSNEIFRSPRFQLPLNRQDLGEMSNMTKESTTRILKDFEAGGIIALNNKTVEILKMDVLKDISIRG